MKTVAFMVGTDKIEYAEVKTAASALRKATEISAWNNNAEVTYTWYEDKSVTVKASDFEKININNEVPKMTKQQKHDRIDEIRQEINRLQPPSYLHECARVYFSRRTLARATSKDLTRFIKELEIIVEKINQSK